MFQFTSGGELTSGGEFDIRAQVLIFSFKVGVFVLLKISQFTSGGELKILTKGKYRYYLVWNFIRKWLYSRPSVDRYNVAKHTGGYIFGQYISHAFFRTNKMYG